MLEALLAWLLKEAERQPVCVVMEDLHWGDASTLEWLSLFMDQLPTARLLLLLLCRPEFSPPWALRSHLTQIALSRLSRRQVETMVEGITGSKALPVAVLQHLVATTDGVPLFVEELTKMVLESGLVKERAGRYALTGPLPPLAIPATLHDSLTARLDRLGPAKQVAQLGATVGREFAYEVIWAVSSVDEETLRHALTQLVAAELLYQQGLPPQARYRFKHALIQEAAYASLLRSTRRQYHQQIAQVLEERFPETCATQPELLAQHYTEARLSAQALPYWQRAGQRAIQHSAYVEAISHLSRGLEVLKTLPETNERLRQELEVQMTLGGALTAVKGVAAPEVEAVSQRARALCQQVGEPPQLLVVLSRLGTVYNNRGQYQAARELGEQVLRLAQRVQDPAELAYAHQLLGNTAYFLGEFEAARTHMEQSIDLYNPQQDRAYGLLNTTHLGVFCRGRLAQFLWFLGYPDQALQRSQEALTLAHELGCPLNLVIARRFAATLHQFRREGQLVLEQAEAAMVLAREQGFAHRLAEATILLGWALAAQGQGAEGMAQIRQGLAAYQATGSETGRPYHLALLTEGYDTVSQREEGLRVLAEALATAETTEERYWEAELYRLKGELLLQSPVQSPTSNVERRMLDTPPETHEAENCFHQALDIARRQAAKSLELRAAMSLSRLWQQQGKRDEARELLAPLYGWFTEGFDTADLQEAKALLEALA
jgi:predicted ATPase